MKTNQTDGDRLKAGLQTRNDAREFFLGFLVMLGFIAILVALSGCNTPPATVAYRIEGATDVSVDVAMTGWGAYVAAKHPGTNAELQVVHAFDSVKSAELLVVDATEAAVTNSSATNGIGTAQAVLSASETNLFNLLNNLTNSIPAK